MNYIFIESDAQLTPLMDALSADPEYISFDTEFLRERTYYPILCLLQLAALIATWPGWLSLLPIVANIAATVGGYTHNPRKVRLVAMLINSPLWIVYDVLVGSWAGILDELITELSILISIRRFGWKNLDRTE